MCTTAGCVSSAPGETCRRPATIGAGFAMRRNRWIHGRCAMSAALVILPVVWATEALHEVVVERPETAPELAFYRKYTEGLLRRYVRLSLEAGRAASLLGPGLILADPPNYRLPRFHPLAIFFLHR